MDWREECRATGKIFGLAQWTIEMMCLLRNNRPEQSSLVAEVNWPKIEVVTEIEDTQFQQWLGYYAWMHDRKAIYKKGSVETIILWLDQRKPPLDDLPPSSLPPRHTAFWMRVETPPFFPPEARAQLEKDATELERELLRDLGYTNVPRRLRSSPLMKRASELEAETDRLPLRGLYRIAAETTGDEYTEVDQDKQTVKTIKTRRHRVKKRFDQYK
jgi:hypothetical protein